MKEIVPKVVVFPISKSNMKIGYALLHFGASVNIISLSIVESIQCLQIESVASTL